MLTTVNASFIISDNEMLTQTTKQTREVRKMMMEEFTKLTGIEPTWQEYLEIEKDYYSFKGDKTAFCKDFVRNNRMVEVLRRMNEEAYNHFFSANEKARNAEEKINELELEIKRLQKIVEREQEWEPYESEHNVKQADYERLDSDPARRELTDNEAIEMISDEFGFEKSRIRIIHEVDKEEINRHRNIRKVGTYQRKALFDAWDWNYIRFNVIGNTTMGYEMYKGDLQLYWG